MRRRYRFKACLAVTVVGALLVSAGSSAGADDADTPKPLALRKIMRDMGKNMQDITDSISREDWETVESIAPLIADHQQPPLFEKMRILSFFGTNVSEYKEFDEKTRQAAQALEQAAVRRNGTAVISSFATLQNSCLACHQGSRKRFVEHFYGQR